MSWNLEEVVIYKVRFGDGLGLRLSEIVPEVRSMIAAVKTREMSFVFFVLEKCCGWHEVKCRKFE